MVDRILIAVPVVSAADIALATAASTVRSCLSMAATAPAAERAATKQAHLGEWIPRLVDLPPMGPGRAGAVLRVLAHIATTPRSAKA